MILDYIKSIFGELTHQAAATPPHIPHATFDPDAADILLHSENLDGFFSRYGTPPRVIHFAQSRLQDYFSGLADLLSGFKLQPVFADEPRFIDDLLSSGDLAGDGVFYLKNIYQVRRVRDRFAAVDEVYQALGRLVSDGHAAHLFVSGDAFVNPSPASRPFMITLPEAFDSTRLRISKDEVYEPLKLARPGQEIIFAGKVLDQVARLAQGLYLPDEKMSLMLEPPEQRYTDDGHHRTTAAMILGATHVVAAAPRIRAARSHRRTWGQMRFINAAEYQRALETARTTQMAYTPMGFSGMTSPLFGMANLALPPSIL